MFFSGLALTAFAANSVLCRLALGDEMIDASSFTIVRLLSGTIVLVTLTRIRKSGPILTPKRDWSASFMLFLYAISFSFAYVTLDTATGALILFGAVQITIILLSVISGNRLHLTEWLGVIIAFTGFVYLLLPGVSTPSLIGFLLMTIAGIAWGIYTLKGRHSKNPLEETANNFLKTLPIVIIVIIVTIQNVSYTTQGVVLAALSGGLASGIGYSIWYLALGGLSTTLAAALQLTVPVIAAWGGVIFVSEEITLRLTISASMILGGILTVVLGRYYFVELRNNNQKR
ncbi:MAG: DMT family transporter [Fidelibacterota bacterium]